MSNPIFVLASNSPRRKTMIEWTGWRFVSFPADVDESRLSSEAPADYVLRLADAKARVAAARSRAAGPFLAADTIVVDGDELLGKPETEEDAQRMLKQLRGRSHQVFTALALYDPPTLRMVKDICTTQVPMRYYTDKEIEQYIKSGDPFDKAGAYAIQHKEFHPVENFHGCFASVMGLPLCHVLRSMRQFGYEPRKDVPGTCQNNLGYICPITDAILRGEQVG
jgi:septum formation protein